MVMKVMHDEETGAASTETVQAMVDNLTRHRPDGPEMSIRVKRTAGANFIEIGGRIIGKSTDPQAVLAGAMYLQQVYREFLLNEK